MMIYVIYSGRRQTEFYIREKLLFSSKVYIYIMKLLFAFESNILIEWKILNAQHVATLRK